MGRLIYKIAPTLPAAYMAEPRVDCGAFVLVAAINPCLCGYYGDQIKPWSCAPSMVTEYQKRISGPLLDRIDIHVEVPQGEDETPPGAYSKPTSVAVPTPTGAWGGMNPANAGSQGNSQTDRRGQIRYTAINSGQPL